MKKILSLLLVLAMMVSMMALASCGSGSASSNDTSSPAASSNDTSSTAASSSDSSDSSTPDESAETVDPSQFDTLELTTATSYNETDFSGELIAWFGNYLEEHSGGAVTLSCYYGGSFCSDAEVYDYVMSGDMNLSFVQPVYAMTYFPYAFGIASSISNENAVDTGNGLIYDNAETAALIEEQGAANNLHLLAHTSAGSSIFLGKTQISSFEEASNFTIGSPINLEIYSGYGFGTVAVEPTDMYDSLSRGVCNLVAFSAVNAYTQKLYEVAPYIGDCGAYFTNQIICLNNDVWNSLNEATQNLLIEAALAVCDYSIELVGEYEQALIDECEAAGGAYVQFPDGEGNTFIETSMLSNSELIRGFAANIGCEEGMEVIIQGWADGLGYDSF